MIRELLEKGDVLIAHWYDKELRTKIFRGSLFSASSNCFN